MDLQTKSCSLVLLTWKFLLITRMQLFFVARVIKELQKFHCQYSLCLATSMYVDLVIG